MQLIVVGMHRSGTSMLARLLNLMGMYFAPEGTGTGANQENPKGFWERRDVRALNDFVLHSVGCDWNRVSTFDVSRLPDAIVEEFHVRASRIVLEMDAHRPWFLKEPRLCLLIPLWRRVLEVPVCVHILRHPVEVAASLRTRNQIPMEAGLALWEAYNRAARDAMSGLPQVQVIHRDLVRDPVGTVAGLHRQLESLGVRRLSAPAASEVAHFVSRDLYREREGATELSAYSQAPQVGLFEQWCGQGQGVKTGELSSVERGTLAAYEATLPPLAVPPKPADKATEAELRSKAAAAERQVQTLKLQEQQAQTMLKKMDQHVAFLEREFASLRENNASRESTASELLAVVGKLLVDKEGREQMDKRLEHLGNELARSREEVSRLQREAGEARDLLSREKESGARAVRELERSLQQLNKDLTESRDKLRHMEREAVEARDSLVIEREEAGRAARELEKSLQQLGEELAHSRNEFAQLQRDSDQMGHALAREQELSTGLTHELETAKRAGLDAAKASAALEAQLGKQAEEIVKLSHLLLGTNSALGSANAQLATLREEHASLLSRHSKEAADAATLRAKLKQELDAAAQQHAQDLAAAASRNAELERELVEKTGRLSALRDAAFVCGAEIDRLNSQLGGMQGSSSWRVTAPMRHGRRLLLGTKNTPNVPPAVEILRRSPWFDRDWYVARNPEVASSGLSAEVHYLICGAAEGADPSPNFDAGYYLARNPDVAESGQNPLLHFIQFGEAEGRLPAPRDRNR